MRSVKLAALSIMLLGLPAAACTLWGAAGSASADGTLLAKNRDWLPDHLQSVRLMHPAAGMAYLGLYADNSTEPGIKGGVNEAGLSIVSAEASSLPKAVRNVGTQRHGLITPILSRYHNLDEVANHADTLFGDAKPVFLLLADSKGLMQVEIGQEGHYAITRSQNGTLAHTNHYFDTSLISESQKIGNSSATRLARVNTLLADNKGPHTLDEFSNISQDHHDGANNSLWRNGKEFTLAGWQIALPANGAPHLHLVVANPEQVEQKVDWKLDATFWAQPAKVLLGNGAGA
jgi:isopenicillin-N N-acyltransferase-like protein